MNFASIQLICVYARTAGNAGSKWIITRFLFVHWLEN